MIKKYFKILTMIIILISPESKAYNVFIEPGIFVDMFDGESITYVNGDSEYSGTLRNKALSYAMKFGVHHGRIEFGLESELYNLSAHFNGGSGGEGFSKEVQVTYNSLFIGYEILEKNILYFSVSHTPFLTSGNESYSEEANVLSLEYAYHIKEWVSVNIKIESTADLKVEGATPRKEISYKDLVLVGFSFPLSSVISH
ncbi:MAG: hypothetical protein CME65_02865 [Halobacteriovoraceae bacterium]|nr:hypothetical protein [Halobacteriovoraceae bacterium]|tara:strand:- start:2319 stop:2915 length:597 start_codon:yes stop_codon:yes gene_type:complete